MMEEQSSAPQQLPIREGWVERWRKRKGLALLGGEPHAGSTGPPEPLRTLGFFIQEHMRSFCEVKVERQNEICFLENPQPPESAWGQRLHWVQLWGL